MMRLPRFWKIAIAITLVTAVAIASSVLLFAPNANHFSSYSQVQAAGLIDKGWVPDFLPEDSFKIVHQHDLDTSESATEFSFTTSFLPKIKGQLRPVPRDFLAKRRSEAREVEWAFPNTNSAQYFEIQSSDMDGVLVVDDVSKRALYWTSRTP